MSVVDIVCSCDVVVSVNGGGGRGRSWWTFLSETLTQGRQASKSNKKKLKIKGLNIVAYLLAH